ncbi:WYL domain-containing protein [Muribaculaceae bacterium Isolate-002 (NCI)]|nr:WYL domain-containing protein [Muribaculaceae bacterium Isolate-002 (NCI)]
MARNLLSRYIWLVDTIRRRGSITRRELDEAWKQSIYSDGNPLPRRTFYNYRAAVEELFNITIGFNPSDNTYHIAEDPSSEGITDWLLNSVAMTNMLSDSRDVADKIFLEEVPSAREHLPSMVSALKEGRTVEMDYQPYTRQNPSRGIVLHPYFLKIFRQRWYVTGLNVADDRVKTYALDRIVSMRVTGDTYTIPDYFDAPAYFRDSFGIIFNRGEVKEVILRVDARQAKYFRALPLHHSQQETVSDGYSLFSYRLKLSDDFVQEILSHGPSVTVVRPAELRAIVTTSLRATLDNYET